MAGYAGDNPTIEGMSGWQYRGGAKAVRQILDTYDEYKRGDKTFAELRREINMLSQDGYIECQYHGMLTMDDVESITFPFEDSGLNKGIKTTFARMKPEKRKEVVTYLKSRGIILNYERNGKLYDGYEYLEKEYGGV